MGGVVAGAAEIFGGAAAADAGIGAAAALEGGFTAADIAAGTLSVGDALAQGATVGELVSAGAPIGDLIASGVSVADLTAAGATAEQIAAATPMLEAAASGAESIPFQLADGSMGSIQGGNILDAAGNVVAKGGVGTTLGDLAGYAKTGAQLIGGIGQFGQAASLLGWWWKNQARCCRPIRSIPFTSSFPVTELIGKPKYHYLYSRLPI